MIRFSCVNNLDLVKKSEVKSPSSIFSSVNMTSVGFAWKNGRNIVLLPEVIIDALAMKLFNM